VLALALAALGVGVVVGASGGGDSGERAAADSGADRGAPPKPPELPGGGRSFFPERRVVAFYGAPQDDALGILGIGPPSLAAKRLRRQARPYARGGRPVLPAFELIAVVASGAPGADGKYRYRQSARVIDRYLAAARRAGAVLILDVQPGHADFMAEARALRRWLREPDVSLALDPEWHTPGTVPGRVIGSVDASKVNEVSRWLSQLVRRRRLPNKLLVVHQFTESMVAGRERLRRHPGVELVLNVDGFGGREIKIAKYDDFAELNRRRFANGFKLFYEEDTNLLRPRDVLAMRPRPDFVVYE
jgi:hypothetical protein